jgi:hypothetical protein
MVSVRATIYSEERNLIELSQDSILSMFDLLVVILESFTQSDDNSPNVIFTMSAN